MASPVNTTYRGLIARGWQAPAAGNVVAYTVGLPPVASGWTVEQIHALLFLAWLSRTRRLEP